MQFPKNQPFIGWKYKKKEMIIESFIDTDHIRMQDGKSEESSDDKVSLRRSGAHEFEDNIRWTPRECGRLDSEPCGCGFYEGSVDEFIRPLGEDDFEAMPSGYRFPGPAGNGDTSQLDEATRCNWPFSPTIWSADCESSLGASGYHGLLRYDQPRQSCDVADSAMQSESAAREARVLLSSLSSDAGRGNDVTGRFAVYDLLDDVVAGRDAGHAGTPVVDRGVRADDCSDALAGRGGDDWRRERGGDDVGRGGSICDRGWGFDAAPDTTAEASSARLSAKSFLLTYAQCPVNKQDLFDYLLRKGETELLVVCAETHADGNPHLHAYVTYKQKKVNCSMKYFDFCGYHPNIRVHRQGCDPVVSAMNCWNYCLKSDANPLTRGSPPEKQKRKRESAFRDALSVCQRTSVGAAMDVLLAECAYETIVHYEQIERALLSERRKHSKCRIAARPLADFSAAPKNLPEEKALYFWGDTNLGKTAFARALLPEAQLVRHIDQLKGVDFSKGIIFDDFAVSHWPVTSIIHLLDWEEESGINVKHSHVVIPPHTKKIFTSNVDFEKWLPETISAEHLQACRRRMHVVHINFRLFE